MNYGQALELLPPKARRVLYVLVALAGLLMTAAAAYFTAVGDPIPKVIVGGLAAIGTVAVGPLLVAASNVPKKELAVVVQPEQGPEELVTAVPERAYESDGPIG